MYDTWWDLLWDAIWFLIDCVSDIASWLFRRIGHWISRGPNPHLLMWPGWKDIETERRKLLMNNAAAESYDSCTSCGWRSMSKFNNGRTSCPMCFGLVVTSGTPVPASPNLGFYSRGSSWTTTPPMSYPAPAPAPAPVPPFKAGPGTMGSGLPGYCESGTPDDWDMALGTIRGYRWWKLDIPESWAGVRTREVRRGYYDVNGKPEVYDAGLTVLTDQELPGLIGAYSGEWKPGRTEARCKNGHTEIPHWRTSCGCGFWGYFDPSLPCDQVFSNWQRPKRPSGWRSLAVFGSVKGSGRVLVGEKGFRCQYAEIESLAIGRRAVSELMFWNVRIKAERKTPSYQDPYWVNPSGGTTRVAASEDEVQARLAMVEDLLSRAYPQVRIVSSEKTLTALFPPEPGYGIKAAA